MNWRGWGDPARSAHVAPAALDALRQELGVGPADAREPVQAISDVALPEPRELPSVVLHTSGTEVLTDAESRIRNAAGRSYPDLVRLRSGLLEAAPDAVVAPADAAAVAGLLDACAGAGVAVVPFGGGTSVVGGVEPLSGGHERVVSLDLRALRHVAVDHRSMTARLGPGLLGPQAEQLLHAEGVTLGHFPQSFEYASIGGFAATRSAGQSSSGYGRFDDLVTAIELTAPAGTLRTLKTPHTAAGPALRQLVLGSEGALGVITDVTCRVRPAPQKKVYEGYIAESFQAGCGILRELAQSGEEPDVLRLSDEEETRVSLALSGSDGLQRKALDTYLGLRGRRGGCMVICGWEGEAGTVKRRRARSRRHLRTGGAVSLGSAPGSAWSKGRFEGPYLRDALMSLGVFVETLETSHTWSELPGLYSAVGSALRRELGERSIVMCHVSHVYRDGASLYFTFLARADRDRELEQWRVVKTAACEAIVGSGGTITHHHAVGTDHAPYMPAEIGELGVEALRAVKERLDPAGIMNPGKLLPS